MIQSDGSVGQNQLFVCPNADPNESDWPNEHPLWLEEGMGDAALAQQLTTTLEAVVSLGE